MNGTEGWQSIVVPGEAVFRMTPERLIRMEAGEKIIWEILPDPGDHFVQLTKDHNGLGVNTWNGWWWQIDPWTGKILFKGETH